MDLKNAPGVLSAVLRVMRNHCDVISSKAKCCEQNRARFFVALELLGVNSEEIPEPGGLTRTIMKTLEYVDSLNFQEERSTDITMDALRDAALECLDNEEKVERIIIELENLLEQVDDIRLKIKYLSKSWGRMTEIFDSCIRRGRPEMVYQVYYRTFSMIGFYLFTLHRIIRDVPELKGEAPEELAALPDFAQVEIMNIGSISSRPISS